MSRRLTIYLIVALVLLMLSAHVLVWQLDYDLRPYVFGVVSIIYLVWPVLCYFAPKNWLVLMMIMPLFGITLGMMYIGDIGSNKYFFEAQPLLHRCLGHRRECADRLSETQAR